MELQVYFCITAQVDARARVESNYFESSARPHWLQTDGNGTAGIAIDTGNVYTGASSGNTNRDTGGSVFTVPYAYTKEPAATARQRTSDCSGRNRSDSHRVAFSVWSGQAG